MDVKTGYSSLVKGAKATAKDNKKLGNKIRGGEHRKQLHSSSWAPVDINVIVERFTHGAKPIIKNGKVVFYSLNGRYEISADIGGGYLRIFDRKKLCYVDCYGNDIRNFTDERGKQHGRKKSDQLAITHFRILKKEEIKK